MGGKSWFKKNTESGCWEISNLLESLITPLADRNDSRAAASRRTWALEPETEDMAGSLKTGSQGPHSGHGALP